MGRPTWINEREPIVGWEPDSVGVPIKQTIYLTQAEYDALPVPRDPQILYIINPA